MGATFRNHGPRASVSARSPILMLLPCSFASLRLARVIWAQVPAAVAGMIAFILLGQEPRGDPWPEEQFELMDSRRTAVAAVFE